MSKSKKGEGRGLEYFEVALIKRMILDGFPRDRISSFFIRPGRILSPAFRSEIHKGKIGSDIEPASAEELEKYIATRLNEARPSALYNTGPLTPTRVREVLAITKDAEAMLPTLESQILEYKEFFPGDKAARVKIAKSAAGLANARGGYILFGIRDDRTVIGVNDLGDRDRSWLPLFQCINEHFSPAFKFEHAIVEIAGKDVAAIYVYEAENRPIITIKDYDKDLSRGCIYMRYAAQTKMIEPGDLMSILNDRDRRTMRNAQLRAEQGEPA